MKIERTKNAARNLKFGAILKIYLILVPFLMRTVMLRVMGVEYLGLGGLFHSIMQTLNIAELGVNSAMVFTMYRAIADDDGVKIRALMKQYRRYYRLIGLFIAVVGVALVPFLPRLVSGKVPDDVSLYVIYLLELGTTVLTYWLFSYKNCLLSAHQRQDVSSKIWLTLSVVQTVVQLLTLYVLHNYYAYLTTALAVQIAANIITAIVVSRMFPDYWPEGELEQSELSKIHGRIRDLFFAKVAGTIVTSSDSIVISAFLGLRVLAIYQNYYYIMNSVVGFLLIISSSTIAGIGNSLITETREKNYQDFRKLAFLMLWLITVCTCCFACMYQPFMELWVGKEHLFADPIMLLFCVYFYVYMVQRIGIIYKDASGIWRDDRTRTIVTALTNLVLNLAFVRWFGVYAIILSTVFSYLVVGTPWLIRNLFRRVFERSPREYVVSLLGHTLLTAAVCAACYLLSCSIPLTGIAALAVRLLIAVSLSNLALFLLYRRSGYYAQSLQLVKRLLKRSF